MKKTFELNIREAILDDSQLYLQWRNDPQVRNSAFNSNEITLDMHQAWYSEKLNCNLSKLYVLSQNEVLVGQVRFELNDELSAAEINYSISSECRGKGLAVPLMRKSMETIFSLNSDLKKLIAKVKVENTASNRVFEKLNFVNVEQFDQSMNIFEYYKKSER